MSMFEMMKLKRWVVLLLCFAIAAISYSAYCLLSNPSEVILEATPFWQRIQHFDQHLSLRVQAKEKGEPQKATKDRVYTKPPLSKITANPSFSPVQNVDCQSPPQSGYTFCKTGIDPMVRALDLTSRLTEDELIRQTSNMAPAIPRLGLKAYDWRSNCLHGWSLSGGHWKRSNLKWTVFPAPIGLGATFNEDLVKRIGKVTATEGRALHNELLVQFNGSSTEAAGLNCFSPNVNLFRDPRWGRGQETFGEDPFLISVVGNAYTIGLQEGEDSRYLKVAACAKHYAVHSGPEERRLSFKAYVSLHDLFDTYIPAFKSQVIGAKVAQIMPAYSGLVCKHQEDGAPDVANTFLLKTLLREQFGAHNISVVSDNDAIVSIVTDHHFVSDHALSAALCLNATTDLDLGHDEIYNKYLKTALKANLTRIETLKESVTRNFYLRMRVGDFDPPSAVPYQYINKADLDTPKNRALNLQAARESIVLLKNVNRVLPLQRKSNVRIAVLGPNANSPKAMLSNYEGIPSKTVTVLEGITNAAKDPEKQISYAPGCSDIWCRDFSGFPEALTLVESADYIIMVMGLDLVVEDEHHDRGHSSCNGSRVDRLGLPGCQRHLVETLLELDRSVILVLVNGGALSIPSLYHHRGVVGIIEAFYPGAQGGNAVADVLFGDFNPSGKMPVTVYNSVSEFPSLTDYGMRSGQGRTYRYSTAKPLFPFGFGLSYSEFSYTALSLSSETIQPCEELTVTVSIKNVAKAVAGSEVILVYLLPPTLPDKPFFPKIELVGFKKVYLEPKQTSSKDFILHPYLLSLVYKDGINYLFPGKYTVQVGMGINNKTRGFTIDGQSPVKVQSCVNSPQCLAC